VDPVAVHLIGVFVIGAACAIGYVWVRRILRRRTGVDDPKLRSAGALLVVAFVFVVGLGVTAREFFPETAVGSWLRTEGVMMNFVIACVAVLALSEALLKWLGVHTSKEDEQRDV